MLAALLLMLVLMPAFWLWQSAADRQRVLDAQVRASLRPAARAPAPAGSAAGGASSPSGADASQSR